MPTCIPAISWRVCVTHNRACYRCHQDEYFWETVFGRLVIELAGIFPSSVHFMLICSKFLRKARFASIAYALVVS